MIARARNWFYYQTEAFDRGANYLCGIVIINQSRHIEQHTREGGNPVPWKKKRKAVSQFSQCRADLVDVERERKRTLSVLRFNGSGEPRAASLRYLSLSLSRLSLSILCGKQCYCVAGNVCRIRHLLRAYLTSVLLTFKNVHSFLLISSAHGIFYMQ